MIRRRRRLLGLALVLLAAVLVAASSQLHGRAETAVELVGAVIQQHPGWGLLAFVTLAALSAMFSFFSSVVIVPVRLQFLLADLHGGLLTYGEFARKRQELAAQLDAKFEELRQLVAQQSAEAAYRAQQLANDARRAAALEEQAANQRRIQQQLQESTGPRLRQPLNCTTNYFGSSAQTTCN